jgi:rhomboid protease GluP
VSHADSVQPPADAHQPPDTFCAYFAKHLIVRKGYVPGTFPEAAELAAHCDTVLTRHDGYSLVVACLVDRDAHPGKTFTMAAPSVEAIGQALLPHTGRVHGAKLPVTIEIFEVGPAEPDASQRRRLEPYTRAGWHAKVVQYAWIIDTASGAVWANTASARLLRAGSFRKLLTAPRVSDAELQPAAVAATPTHALFPWLTCAIIAALVAIFAAEMVYGIGPWSSLLQPSIATLIAFGGLMRSLVLQSGEWYRLLSAPLLHVDAAHLALNCVALFLAGRALEGLIGRAWFATIFVVGAVAGAALSLLLMPDTRVSVGASDGITALFAAMLVIAFHFPAGAGRTPLLMDATYVLVPSLLPLAPALQGHQVDYAAHFGGALGGVAVGALILALWPSSETRPRLRPLAAGVALIGLFGFIYPALPLSRNYASAVLAGSLNTQAQVPKSDEEAKAKAAELAAQYPRDPRAHFYRAVALLDARDGPGAEKALRDGLAEEELWRSLFNPELPLRMRTMLALVVSDTRPDEAKILAKPVCESGNAASLRTTLEGARLCAP